MYQRSWIRLKHGLDSEGLSGSINSAKPFQPKSEQKEVWLSSPCSTVSAVTRPIIIHRFGGGGWESNVLKWMLWSRWHSYVGGGKDVEAVLICTACYQSVIHVFLAALSQFYHGLSDYGTAKPLPANSLFTLFILSHTLSAACEVGFYKPVAGDGLCGKCPQHSHSETRAALSCPCDSNYYRAADDPPAAPCSRKHKQSTQDHLIPVAGTHLSMPQKSYLLT